MIYWGRKHRQRLARGSARDGRIEILKSVPRGGRSAAVKLAGWAGWIERGSAIARPVRHTSQ
jgi:hypothetical protein